MKRTLTFLMTALFLCVGMTKAAATDLPQLSTDGDIKWYTVKNVRKQKYATYAGDAATMTQQATASAASFFYFTGDATEAGATVKIHNYAAGDKLCAAYNSWTDEGINWFLKAQATGVSICTSDGNWDAWNDARGEGRVIEYWSADDAGSAWEFVLVTDFSSIIDIAALKEAAIAEMELLASVPVLYPSATDAAAEVNAVKSAGTSLDELNAAAEAIEAIVANYKNAAYKALEGKYFTISTPGRNNLFMNLADERVKGIASVDGVSSALWQFQYVDGAVKVYNPATEMYLCEPQGSSAEVLVTGSAADAGLYQLAVNTSAENPAAKIKFTSNGKSVHMAGHAVLVRWDNGGASEWTVAETVVDITKDIAALLEANAENHAELPALGQYSTEGYNALLEAKNTVTTLKQAAAAVAAFETTKNLPLFTIDSQKDYALGQSIYENEEGALKFKTTDAADKSMLWAFDMTATEVGLTDKVVVRNAATGNLFWGASFISVIETEPAVEGDGVFMFKTEGTGNPVHAQKDGSAIVRWSSADANAVGGASTWKFAFVGVSNPAAYDLSEVAASFKEQAMAFAGLQENAALSALPAVQEKWAEGMGVVEPLFGAVEEGNLVLKADVVAAMEMMAEIQAVVAYYSETFAAAKDEANAAMDELDENSEEFATLLGAINVSAVTTVADLEAKVKTITEVLEYLASLPEVDPNDYTSHIKNAAVTSLNEWNAEGASFGKPEKKDELVKYGSGKLVDFNQTITIPAGKYKMTAKAVYRYTGSEQSEYEAIQAGTNTHLAKLYAETSSYKYETNVMNRWEGASDTDYAAGNGSVTVNGKFVPNSSAAVKAWFDNGMYVNELVFNVQADGEVKIGIETKETVPGGEYTNISAWTLTRLGDAEADPKEEEPTPDPEYPADVTAQYLTNAGFDDASSWITEGNVDKSAKEVAGWTVKTTGTDWYYGAAVGYGSATTVNNVAAPATNPEGVAEGGALGISVGWGCIVEYTQNVVLPAGVYTVTYKAINVNDTATQASNLIGFKTADASYYGKNTVFAANTWVEESVTFVLEEETAGAISVGIGAISGGSGSNAKLFIDGVTISYDPEIPSGDLVVGDVTDQFLANARFEQPSAQNGGAINTPPGWTLKHETSGWLDGSTRQSTNPGGDGSQCYNLWAGTVSLADIYQTVALPAGKYKLTVGLYSDGDAERYAYVTVGGNTIKSARPQFGSWDFVSVEFSNPTEGEVTMGAVSKGWFQIDNVTLEYLGEVNKDDFVNAYNLALSEAQALVGQKMSVAAAAQLDAAIAQYGSLTAENSTDELEAATDAILAELVSVKASVNSYKVLSVGALPDNSLEGWTCTNSNTFHINTWSGEGNSDGTNMVTPFIENWVGKESLLGNGKISYTLPGVDPGYYKVSSLIRVYSEANNDIAGASFFANEVKTDFATGKPFTYNNMKGIYDVYTAVVNVGEEGVLEFGVEIENPTFNWVAFKNVKIEYIGESSDEALVNAAKEAFTTAYDEFGAALAACQAMMLKMSFYEIDDAAYQLNEQLETTTDVDALNTMAETLAEATASLKEINEVYAGYDVFVQKFKAAAEISEPTTTEAAEILEFNMYGGAGMQATSLEALAQAVETIKADYFTYIANAKLLDGNMFDLTYLIQNPNFDKNMEGWTCVNAGHNGGAGYDNVGGIAEIALWGAESWEASISQTLNELPNGKYIVKAAWMAASGIEMTFVANEGKTPVTGIGDQGGNIDNDGNVVEMGQGFRGWQYVEVEGLVEDGTLTITVNSSSTTLHTWSNADAFELYYAGDISYLYDLDEPIEGDWVDVTNEGAWPIIDHAELLGLGDYWVATNNTRYDEERGVMEFVAGENATASLIQEYCPFGQATYRLTGKAFHKGATNAVMFVGDQTVEIPAAAEGATFENAEEYFTTFSIEFTCEAAWGTQLTVGYSCEFDSAEDFLVVGGLKLEAKKSTTLRNLFEETIMACESLGWEIMKMTELHAQQQAVMATAMPIYEAIMGGEKVLKAEVEQSIEEMNAVIAELSPVAEYYKGEFMDALWAAEEMLWELDEASQAYTDLEAAIAEASDVAAVTTVAELEAKVAALEELMKLIETGIDNIEAETELIIYDLSGRRVYEMTKGVYIVNGKKVIKK